MKEENKMSMQFYKEAKDAYRTYRENLAINFIEKIYKVYCAIGRVSLGDV